MTVHVSVSEKVDQVVLQHQIPSLLGVSLMHQIIITDAPDYLRKNNLLHQVPN